MFQVLMGGMQGMVRLLVGAWWRKHEITIREFCGLTRRKRGPNYTRYERGEIKPPVALIKFFQVLDRHPELLSELK